VTLPVLPPIRIKTSPEKQSILLPPVNNVNMGRRVSLANGEAAKIEMWVAKRVAAGQGIGVGGGTGRPPGHISPFRSPIAGQAAAARRSSIPYPTPIPENQTQQQPLRSPNGLSPKISPSVRPMPSTLHLTALRNNSRRASMPGAAQLISSGPFTPPRVISGNYPIGSGNGRTRRELSPIKDHDGDHAEARHQLNFVFGDTDFSTTYLTPPSSTYLPSNTSPTSYLPPDSGSMVYDYSLDPSQHAPFTPNGPLPNPTFSFGSGSTDGPSNSGTDDHSVWMSMQPRVRMGSLASINTFTTDGGVPDSGSDFGQDWMTPPGTEGFDPDARRASAYVKSSNKAAPRRKKRQADKRNRPADLLHHLGILGIDTNLPLTATNGAHPLRPSPLGNGNGNGFTMDSFGQPVYQFQPSFQSDHFQSDSTTINYSISADGYRTHSNPPSDHSPLSSESAPSPTHVNIPTFTSPGYSLTSLSSFSNHSQSTQPQPFIMQPVNQHRYGEMVGQQRVGVVEGKDDFGFFPELGGEPVNVLV